MRTASHNFPAYRADHIANIWSGDNKVRYFTTLSLARRLTSNTSFGQSGFSKATPTTLPSRQMILQLCMVRKLSKLKYSLWQFLHSKSKLDADTKSRDVVHRAIVHVSPRTNTFAEWRTLVRWSRRFSI
jgi:hypothetical protein